LLSQTEFQQMQANFLSPRQALNKAFLKVKPNRSGIEQFKSEFSQLLERIDLEEHEEHLKNDLTDFLKNAWYSPDFYINTKGRNDLVIHTGKDSKSAVGVIIEAKKPANKGEMLRANRLNVKALHELILYYLRERITEKNLEIKHLIATNIWEWFIFDATVFEKAFAGNKTLVKQFQDFEAGRLAGTTTDFFYKEIAEPFVAALAEPLEFTWLDIRTYEKPLRNQRQDDDRKLIPLYKVLSPEHLLKLPFQNDSNSLDKRFYAELLHLIGLGESKEKGKKLIGRLPKEERNKGSLLELTIVQLDAHDEVNRLPNAGQYGTTNEERLYNVALELCITWVNRILFLKLLEAQLLNYHKGDKKYNFLSLQKIADFDALDSLFFQVLARRPDERAEEINRQFRHVPYLNSSLFEATDLERQTIYVSNLADNTSLPILSGTVLRNAGGKKHTGKLGTLEYLFSFLDAYDFSSEGSEDIQEENKTLINASVLGLIFEKINGYKDGSFFTPGFITMYMCRETLRRAVVQKFNEAKGWACTGFEQLYDKIEDKQEANSIINSLKICDPAVGSGHFLVSALNELLAIKSELKILLDREGKTLRDYHIEVVNDELVVLSEEGKPFTYNPNSRESQRVQETLFHEKQAIIEGCLFGVDINPNSVKICRLRLWVELLKNAYYQPDSDQLETLPNIDINIKQGNSLISRFPLDANLGKALKKSKWNIESYKIAVQSYRHARSKEEKRELETLISDIKGNFRSEIHKNDRKVLRLNRLRGEHYNLVNQGLLFGGSKSEERARKKKEKALEKDIQKLEAEIEEIRNNKIFEGAFEWRFEFPEVLDDEGEFRGFDAIIGNPPYIRQEEISWMKPHLQQNFQTYAGTADIYVFFVELGMRLLNEGGEFTYILPNKWMRAGYGKALREWVKQYQQQEIVDFGDLQVFEEATTYPCIWSMQKRKPQSAIFRACEIETLDFEESLTAYVQRNGYSVNGELLSDQGWTLVNKKVQALLEKLKEKGVPLGEYVEGKLFRGVLTGCNEAFVIDEATKEKLISEDPKSIEVIKPFLAGREIKRYQQPKAKNYILFVPWHFPLHKDESIQGASIEAEQAFIEQYPAVYRHLLSFKEPLSQRNKAETGVRYEWYALQRCAATYYEELEKPKILYQEIATYQSFALDENGCYVNNKLFLIPLYNLYLLGLLNSRLFWWILNNTTSKLRGDALAMQTPYILSLPIAGVEDWIRSEIETKVETVIERDRINTSALEAEIDQLVYQLYGLTEEEVQLVEKSLEG
jgi:adenine-specific DNA-methyltransferase